MSPEKLHKLRGIKIFKFYYQSYRLSNLKGSFQDHLEQYWRFILIAWQFQFTKFDFKYNMSGWKIGKFLHCENVNILDCKGEKRPRGCWHIAQFPENFACQNRHGWSVWLCQFHEIVLSPSLIWNKSKNSKVNFFTWFLMKIFQIQNKKFSCRRKNKIWRLGDYVARIWRHSSFNFSNSWKWNQSDYVQKCLN